MEGQGGRKVTRIVSLSATSEEPCAHGMVYLFADDRARKGGAPICVCSIVRIIVYALERARKMCALLLLLVDECSSFCREFGVQVNVSVERDARWLCSLVGKWKYSFDEFIIECRGDYLSKSHNCIDF